MNILVTGGAGFIGSHIAMELNKAGHHVRTADNFDPYYSPREKRKTARMLLKNGVLTHEVDLAVDPLEPILEKIDLVIHAAAQPGIHPTTPYSTYLKNNFQATVAIVEALEKLSIPLIHISTSSVYGINASGDEKTLPAPSSPYGVTKLAAEAAVLSSVRGGRLKACVVRYFSVFGERERPDKLIPSLFYALKHDTQFPLYEGSLLHERSYTYVGDVVEGTLLAMKQFDRSAGEIFNLGMDKTSTTAQVLEYAQKIVGKKLKIKTLAPRPGDQLMTKADIKKARNVLGYQPKVTLLAGMERTWEWAKEEL